MKNRICIYLLLFVCTNTFAQTKDFKYQREIIGVTDQWHKLDLPNDIFAKLSSDLSDIRIIGISSQKDTIEAPYLIQVSKESITNKDINFKLLNQSHNKNGYYYSFKVPSKNEINQIKLDFKQDNFDWIVSLEGSQNQKDWYTIIEDYRILSIKNKYTNYQHARLNFPNSKFQYFRVHIKNAEKPELQSAKISCKEVINGKLRKYQINKLEIQQNKKNKTTEINIDLASPVLLSELKIKIEATYDYYRPISIRYVIDSVKTKKGWKRNYRTITSGTLTSLEQNKFKFKSIKAQHLQVIISNHDNESLNISGIEASGYIWQLLARFKKNTSYYLTYGNSSTKKPNYDITRFKSKIPNKISELNLGTERIITKKSKDRREALFMNEKWLWGIIGIVILLLAWFTFKMMGKTEKQ
ncbi:DUF3999 family protein [Ancylomarina sp. 16SWW S1-10-2]|uniref:DUF3999 family protein n=1 Tax=Ancylomarina sp. 16SWW S1-10-2 TaxID=2499681 RepID=UPI0012AE5D3E|nr:DUF3999 family protein [Ancylomarina sp. 16SWW S1-10-2]MRT93553.1 DUF3999 family protein [Ancylomarina sp. 16SWW S1-10-2]